MRTSTWHVCGRENETGRSVEVNLTGGGQYPEPIRIRKKHILPPPRRPDTPTEPTTVTADTVVRVGGFGSRPTSVHTGTALAR